MNGSNSDLNGWNSDLIGRNSNLIGRNSDLIERNLVKVLMPKIKLAWTDLERVSFKKFVKESNVKFEKIGVDWSRQSQKKVSSNANVSSQNLFMTGHKKPGLTRGAVDATPFGVAFLLTFSLVKK
jgi:hypothetical protein